MSVRLICSLLHRCPWLGRAVGAWCILWGWGVTELVGQTYLPQPIPAGSALYQTYPYQYTGLIAAQVPNSSSRIFGSAAVVKHPRLVFSCANLFFDVLATDPWLTPVRWYRAWAQERVPASTEGQLLRGYYRFAGYAAAAKVAINDPKTFAMDFTVHYAYEDTAGGTFAPVAADPAAALKSDQPKRIMGYPIGLYDATSRIYLMHETGPFTRAFYDRSGAYLRIDEVSTGAGNSGGPVWVSDGAKYYYGGLVVSGVERSTGGSTDRTGVFALDASIDALVGDAIAASTNPAAPVITEQPVSRRVEAGATASFQVVASGSYLKYSWLFNGSLLPGATANTLTLSGITLTQAGTYQAIVANVAGEVRSTVVTLAVDAPPAIVRQPASQSVAEGTRTLLTIGVTGSPTPTLQWAKNGVAIPGATSSLFTIAATQASDAGSYTCTVSSPLGTLVSAAAVLTVTQKAPVIVAQPTSRQVALGAPCSFSVTATGVGLAYRWLFNGATLAGASTAKLSLASVTAAHVGSYQVVVSNALGEVRSDPATLTLGTAPAITTPPVGATVAFGHTASFAVVASGSAPLTYQWYRNGVPLPGETDSTLVLERVKTSAAGDYTCTVTNGVGSITAPPVPLVVQYGRLVNLSVRAQAGSDDATLIVGFIVHGTARPTLLARGIGPSLGAYGVPGALADPALALYSGSLVIASNDNWGTAANVSTIAATSARLGAFALDVASRDAVLLAPLDPGAYTAQVSAQGAAPGVVLLEVYDTAPSDEARLVNLAARTQVGTGAETLIAGFVITGNAPKPLLIRGVGPTLANFGVAGALADPWLDLFRQGNVTPLQANDNWGGTAEAKAAFAATGAFMLADDSRDAVLLVTLDPGAYTVQVSGRDGAKGVAMVEIYELP